MISLADQPESNLGGPWSVLVRQQRDHLRLDRLLQALPVDPGPEQDVALRRVARLVFPHAFAEESVLWPVLRRVLPTDEAERLTLQVEEEHQEVNEVFARLEDRTTGLLERRELIARLVSTLQDDVRDEEDALLPRLQDALDVRRLRLLGVAWEVVRRTAPTRPHPGVSRRPPGNALAALPLTILDRARDALEAGARRPGAAAGWMGSAGRTLGRVAQRVERVPVVRRGEREPTHR